MRLPLYQVDAFAETLFAGNPAAVCVLPEWLDDSLLQSIASENNLSETAFIKRNRADFDIRWFTPDGEVDLCGHATLAAAHVIHTELDDLHTTSDIVFHTQRRGKLMATAKGREHYQLDFPALDLTVVPNVPAALLSGLSLKPRQVLVGLDYVCVYDNEQQVRQVDTQDALLSTLDRRGVVITAPGESFDVVSRCFYPKYAIHEDPVTGSAHAMLVPYWASVLGKTTLQACQASTRGGVLACEYQSDRVRLSGRAITYLKGMIRV